MPKVDEFTPVTTVYKCEHNCYYVHTSLTYQRPPPSAWTDLHPIVRVVQQDLGQHHYARYLTTLLFMERYGVDRVRGGTWTSCVLSQAELINIKDLMDVQISWCSRCGGLQSRTQNCPCFFLEAPTFGPITGEMIVSGAVCVPAHAYGCMCIRANHCVAQLQCK